MKFLSVEDLHPYSPTQTGIHMARSFDACTCWAGSIARRASRLDQEDQPDGSADPAHSWDEWPQLWAAGQFAQGETPCKLSAMPSLPPSI